MDSSSKLFIAVIISITVIICIAVSGYYWNRNTMLKMGYIEQQAYGTTQNLWVKP